MHVILWVHVAAGGVALLAGAAAVVAAKGSSPHIVAGRFFVAAMLAMAATGGGIAAVERKPASVVAALLAGYLVLTALAALRPGARWMDAAFPALALTIASASLAWGTQAVLEGDGRFGVPPPIFFVFGVVALIGAAGDVRGLRSGPARGRRRLARHLWRMCFALWIASASFFLGQADIFPPALRAIPLLVTLAFLPLGVMVYWLWRSRAGVVGADERVVPPRAAPASP
jgi:hypothetical protein